MSKDKKKNDKNLLTEFELDKYIQIYPFQYITLDNHETISYRIINSRKKDMLKNKKLTKKKQQYIVFLHGNLSGQRHWEPLFPYLTQREDFTYVTIDLRGFGRSSYLQRVESLEDFADDVKKVIDELDIKQFMLVGWSMGGGIALNFAIKYPSMVTKLFLVSCIHYQGYNPIFNIKKLQFQFQQNKIKLKQRFPPFMQKDPETKELERVTDIHTIEDKSKRIDKSLKDKDKNFLRIFFGSMLVQSKKKWFAQSKVLEAAFKETLKQRNYVDSITCQHFFDISEQISQLCCPVLFYHGDTDVLIPLEKAKDNLQVVRKYIGKENCILIVKKQCGHAVVFEYPKDVARTLLVFADLNFRKKKNIFGSPNL
ncbi:hypothetical protein PPERSA_11827 [Pseudocohnilembus persalinus]|uniref:AB hydrolase-1 domain-containing protein n=1 Tax=Pseudocohnilembus persalinus TaxID=266149 RepID=A0A0V0QJR8_PSEPJ|nr:hypothetical protein PPERSA_11827 [Pseudocohnilembus persalinus]|eukprot:KRX02487.1 hypothetical protein PPERSA_11827 [Pseudocohnilembus persalinus]